MPKAVPHFDYAGLCLQALEQDLGLIIASNNPGGFRRVLYKHMRAEPAHRLHILEDPERPNTFFLLKASPEHLLESADVEEG